MKKRLSHQEIKQNLMIGDYHLASKILNISNENIRQRFARKKQDALETLQAIIENRKAFLKKMGVDN